MLLQELIGLSVDHKACFPLRIGLNVLYYSPKQEHITGSLLDIPLTRPSCHVCDNRTTVAAIAPSTVTDDSIDNNELSPMSPRCDHDIERPDQSTSRAHEQDEANIMPALSVEPRSSDAAMPDQQLDLHDCHVENPLA